MDKKNQRCDICNTISSEFHTIKRKSGEDKPKRVCTPCLYNSNGLEPDVDLCIKMIRDSIWHKAIIETFILNSTDSVIAAAAEEAVVEEGVSTLYRVKDGKSPDTVNEFLIKSLQTMYEDEEIDEIISNHGTELYREAINEKNEYTIFFITSSFNGLVIGYEYAFISNNSFDMTMDDLGWCFDEETICGVIPIQVQQTKYKRIDESRGIEHKK